MLTTHVQQDDIVSLFFNFVNSPPLVVLATWALEAVDADAVLEAWIPTLSWEAWMPTLSGGVDVDPVVEA
jgi:hypothetical protein